MSIQSYVVANDLPAPVTAGGIQAFTDVYGEQWVAKPGVYSGNWRKARDVLHAVIYRNATLPMPTAAGTFLAYDTVQRDTYGMFSSNGFLIPAVGLYRIQGTCNTTTTATAQYESMYLYGGPSAGTQLTFTNTVTTISGGISCRSWIVTKCAVNDLIKVQAYVNVASQNVQLGLINARLEISYIGTG